MPNAEYYAKHKDRLQKEKKDKKEWLKYYEEHRETVKQKARARYYKKKGMEVPPPKEKQVVANVVEVIEHIEPVEAPVAGSGIDEKSKRLAELIAELRELVPEVVKPKRKKYRRFVDGKPLPAESE